MPTDVVMLPSNASYLAPDGSEIRLLASANGGGLAHCVLPPGATSKAVRHRTVEELWYVIEGEGTLRRQAPGGTPHHDARLTPGTSLRIDPGTTFQFRTDGASALAILIATLPPWPGKEEAVACDSLFPTP